jgi:hypothetical protein
MTGQYVVESRGIKYASPYLFLCLFFGGDGPPAVICLVMYAYICVCVCVCVIACVVCVCVRGGEDECVCCVSQRK